MEEETRKNAIFRYMVDGESPKDIYTNLHRSKKWFFKWLKRFQSGDSHWYEDQSRAPLIKIRETGQFCGGGGKSFNRLTHLFAHRFSAVSLLIPACLQIELKVPCGILRLFRGTITTRIRPAYEPSKTSSLPRLLSTMPI